MSQLSKDGFCVPVAIPNMNGNFFSRVKIFEDEHYCDIDINENIIDPATSFQIHCVRLLLFIPGTIFGETVYNETTFYKVGKFVAQMDNALEGCKHPALMNFERKWSLTRVPQLSEIVGCILDKKNKSLIDDVIKAFNNEVVSNYDKLRKGVIHGDINEQNILMEPVPDHGNPKCDENYSSYDIKGIIDFGDSCYTFMVFELALTIMYMAVESPLDPVITGGHVIAGYQSERELTDAELDVLRVCVAARFAQSLAIGEYTATQDSENEYTQHTATKGWEKLRTIWSTSKDETSKIWMKVLDDYKQY